MCSRKRSSPISCFTGVTVLFVRWAVLLLCLKATVFLNNYDRTKGSHYHEAQKSGKYTWIGLTFSESIVYLRFVGIFKVDITYFLHFIMVFIIKVCKISSFILSWPEPFGNEIIKNQTTVDHYSHHLLCGESVQQIMQ